MSIPVIGTAVVNSSYWVSRLIYSIDYPVDNFVIINNNGRGELDEELNSMLKLKHKFVRKFFVVNLPGNIGVSSAWNLIIKSFLNAPYWVICNDDIAFGYGFLKEMKEAAESNKEVGIVHGRPGDFDIGSWDLFLIKDWVINEYGLFDENFYPAYCEDTDYILRIRKKHLERVLELKSDYYHGFSKDYYEGGSQTSITEPDLRQKLEQINYMNFEYMTEKWGPEWRIQYPQEHVCGIEGFPISYTSFDLEFARKKYLGF